MKKFSVLILFFMLAVLFDPVSSFASVNESNYYEHLKTIYTQKNTKLNDYLIDECYKFLKLYPTGTRASEVRYVIGLIYLEKKDYSKAVATFLKGLFLDPNSDRMNDEREQIKKIINNQKYFRKLKDAIDRATEGPFIEKSMENKYYDYLRAMYDINDKKLDKMLIDKSKMYIVEFPKGSKVEDVLSRVAGLYTMQDDYEEAIATYEKIESIFPKSSNIPQNKLTVAKLRYMKIKDYDSAREDFTFIADNYAGQDVAGEAYFYLGEINQNKFKNLNEAINKYKTVAANYVTSQFAVESLFRVSEIYLKKLKDNENAIEALAKVGRDFSGDARAPESYDDIAEIYYKKIKDYDSAIATYKKLADTYPESPISPSRLYKAGYIAEKKIKDYGNAISLYEDLISMFPETKEASKSRTRIIKLKKKMTSKY